MISKRKGSNEFVWCSSLSQLAERVYSERVSQTSQVSIVHITCKWLSLVNTHERKRSLSPGLASQTNAPNLLKQMGLPTHICK